MDNNTALKIKAELEKTYPDILDYEFKYFNLLNSDNWRDTINNITVDALSDFFTTIVPVSLINNISNLTKIIANKLMIFISLATMVGRLSGLIPVKSNVMLFDFGPADRVMLGEAKVDEELCSVSLTFKSAISGKNAVIIYLTLRNNNAPSWKNILVGVACYNCYSYSFPKEFLSDITMDSFKFSKMAEWIQEVYVKPLN